MVNLKNVMSLSLVFSVILSASQVEAHKRSWEESFDDENFEAASAAMRNSPLLDPNEVEGEYYDDRDLIDILVENHLAGNWNLYPRPPVWPIMDPSEISEGSDEDNASKLVLPKIEPETVPGDSTAIQHNLQKVNAMAH